MRLLYLHGINNQGKSADQIKNEWSSHLNRAHGLGIRSDQSFAPYYGNALAGVARLVATQKTGLESGWNTLAMPRLQSNSTRNIGPRAWLNQILGDVESETELGALGLAVLDQARLYFTNPLIRDGILAGVMQGLRLHRPDVVIGHSLGSVIAIEAIRAANVPVERLITIGSPLGLNVIKTQMKSPHLKPREVGRWLNIINPNDQVTLNRSLRGPWGKDIVDDRSQGWILRPHSLRRYLESPAMGRAIRSLTA